MAQRAGGRAVPMPRPRPASEDEKAKAKLLPESIDWTDIDGVNYVSPVRDQESCGSCYAFASAAVLESRLRIQTQNARQDVFSTQVCGTTWTNAHCIDEEDMHSNYSRLILGNHWWMNISFQDIVSCTKLAEGCNGGFYYLIGGRYAQDQGLVSEDCNPYLGVVS